MVEMMRVYLRANLGRFIRDERGLTAVEYALVGGLISVAAITAMTAAGGHLDALWEAISNALRDAG